VVRELPSQRADAWNRIAAHTYTLPVVRELPSQLADASGDLTW